jgi:hypothetical protein
MECAARGQAGSAEVHVAGWPQAILSIAGLHTNPSIASIIGLAHLRASSPSP